MMMDSTVYSSLQMIEGGGDRKFRLCLGVS